MAAPQKAIEEPAKRPAPRVGRVGAYPEAATKKISVSIDLEALAWAQGVAKAEGRSLSSVISDIVAQRMRFVAMDEYLAECERLNGPIPPEVQAEVDAELRAAGVIR